MIQMRAALAHTLATVGRRDEAAELLHEIEHPSTPRYIDPYAAAYVHVAFGERDQALNWLDKAVEDMASWLTMFGKCDPRLDPVRSDPRFAEVLRRMRLTR
jgi:hypothetical protein